MKSKHKSDNYVEVMDTTLRDGEQTPGVAFTPAEKLELAKMFMNRLKVDRLEIGSARVSEGERDAVVGILKWAEHRGCLEAMEILGFVDGGKSVDWIKASGGKVINLLTKGSENHCRVQLRKSPAKHFEEVANEILYAEKQGIKVMARNREAYHEYFVEEELEAGIELTGTEVKSIRAGTLNLKDAWCGIKNGEMLVNQMHISPYDHGNIFNQDPMRPRRLLLHKREIMRLYGKVKQDGFALIPLSVYFKGSRVKVNVGLCKGKKLYDKRQSAAERDAKRQIERAMKER